MKSKVPLKVWAAYQAALQVRKNSHSPYSNFKVGSALVSKSGSIFVGCNVENVSYGGTICAERSAILAAVSSGEKSFSDIVVVADHKKIVPPCALCLQTMTEFFDSKTRIWLFSSKAFRAKYQLKQLLPVSFTPSYLI